VEVADEAIPSWFLWSQPLLLLAVLALSLRPLRRAFAGLQAGRVALVFAVLAPLCTALILPQSEYHFAGHEGTYGSLLLGWKPEMDDLQSYGTMPVPLGLSWLLGKVYAGPFTQQVWLVLNRLSLGLVVWLIALIAVQVSQLQPGTLQRARSSATVAAGLTLLCIPMVAWSATGYCVVPALVPAALLLLLALAGQPTAALLWGALAIGTRMELGPVVLVGLLLAKPEIWRRDLADGGWRRLALAVPALLLQVVLLASKKARLPVDSFTMDSSILGENLLNIPLGGPLFWPLVLLAAIVLVALVWPGERGGRVAPVLAGGFLLALMQPMSLIDIGARHFLPATLLGLPLLAVALVGLLETRPEGQGSGDGDSPHPAAARRHPQPAAVMLALLFLVPFGLLAGRDLLDLRWRYVAGQDGYLPRWQEQAARGLRGSVADVLEPSGCYVVLPGGERTWQGASQADDVREVHNSALALREGQCVRWGFADEVEFSGSTSAERVDRAIHTLGLQPVGWLDPPPRGEIPWILFGAGRADNDP